MHPEITQATPGTCSKCGMALVQAGQTTSKHAHSQSVSWQDYMPLIVVITLITLVALITSRSSVALFITNFMIGFFLTFGGFKLFDLNGFVHGYTTYDLLAKRVKSYAYLYPFIELAFGFSMLLGFHPKWLLWLEVGVMTFSGLGVAIKLAKREQFQCACLGTVLKVPLTKVTLIEDFGMAALALLLQFII